MKKFSLCAVIVMIGLSITSCGSSSPLDRKYSDKTFVEDARAIKESKKLSDDDIKLLAGFIVRGKLTGQQLENMTYAEMLKKAKDTKAE